MIYGQNTLHLVNKFQRRRPARQLSYGQVRTVPSWPFSSLLAADIFGPRLYPIAVESIYYLYQVFDLSNGRRRTRKELLTKLRLIESPLCGSLEALCLFNH